MKDKKYIKRIEKRGDYEFYIFKPSPFRLYFHTRKDDAGHRKSFFHYFHMLFLLLSGGYRILYLIKDDEILSYVAYCKAGKRVIAGSSYDDLYTIFIYTFPNFRGCGNASLLGSFMLEYLSNEYRYFYKTISKTNIQSKKVAEKCGFAYYSESVRSKLFRIIIPVDNGTQFLFRAYGKK